MSKTPRMLKLRDQRKPGWFWAENELFDVFQPLVELHGVALYTALCRLARHAEVKVTFRELAELTGMSKDKAQRTMWKLVALRMVSERRGGTKVASTYGLLDLKEAAALGREELQRLLSVAERDRDSAKTVSARNEDENASVSVGDSKNGSAPETDSSLPETDLSLPAANLSLTAAAIYIEKTKDLKLNSPQPPIGGLENKADLSIKNASSAPPRAPRQRLGDQAHQRWAGVGAAGAEKPKTLEELTSADVRDRFEAAVCHVKFGLEAEIEASGAASLAGFAGDPVAEWTQATRSLAYERHEAVEGSEKGIVIVATSPNPMETARVLKIYERRMEAALRALFGRVVPLKVWSQEEAA